ncbi:MAG: hypothetical protein WBV74_15775 [Pseudonocardiaceae bacterium]
MARDLGNRVNPFSGEIRHAAGSSRLEVDVDVDAAESEHLQTSFEAA